MSPALKVDARAKTLAIAAQPPLSADPLALAPQFRELLMLVLADLARTATPFRLVEGFRTVERQQWLYGSGRPAAKPFGRAGPVLTYKDGVKALSNHQGSGSFGSGRAADCYPLQGGKIYIPKASDPVWKIYADTAQARGLVAGFYWKKFTDAPHCELA